MRRLRCGGDGGPVAARRDERRDPGAAGAPRRAAVDRGRGGSARGGAEAGARARGGGHGAQGTPGTAARALTLTTAAFLAFCGVASAHGDPASLYLQSSPVYVPTDVSFPAAKKQRLQELVAAANDAGFTIRVAIVASAYELGAVTELWRRPRVYARFVTAELKDEAAYGGRVLAVMPDGFGYGGTQRRAAYASLAKVRIGPGNRGLIDGAIAGVRRLAADARVTLVPRAPSSSRNTTDRVRIVAAAAIALVLVLATRETLRRRRQA